MSKKSALYRPKIRIEPDVTDRLMEGAALFLLIVLWVLPAIYYNQLPDRIPTHFDGSGNPDRWGGRNSLWAVPAIGLGVYVLFSVLSRYPHHFNYLTKITEENAAYQYRLAIRMLRVVKISVLLIMLYATWATLQAAMTTNGKLPSIFLLLVIAMSIGPMVWYFWKSGQKPKILLL